MHAVQAIVSSDNLMPDKMPRHEFMLIGNQRVFLRVFSFSTNPKSHAGIMHCPQAGGNIDVTKFYAVC